jgi:hypothetical protein
LPPDLLNDLLLLSVLLRPHIFNQFERSRFIARHVLVPLLAELLELDLLRIFNVQKFLFLSDSHVLLLALLFGPGELVKFLPEFFGGLVVTDTLRPLLTVVQQSTISVKWG